MPARAILLGFAVFVLTGCGGKDGSVDQSEVTFVVTNHLNQPKYVDWENSGDNQISCEVEEEGTWSPCLFASPYCKNPCSTENRLEPCCVVCISTLKVKVINPGESIQIVWGGKLYSEDENHCSYCNCYRDEQTLAGNYKASICVFDSFTCERDPCSDPDAEGIIDDASPSGNSLCYEVEFPVEYTKDNLAILID